MDIFGEYIPDKILTNFDLLDYVKKLDIPNSGWPLIFFFKSQYISVHLSVHFQFPSISCERNPSCLLYTSDAADE